MKPIRNWKARKRVDGKNTPSNKERAACAESVLLYYCGVKEGRALAGEPLEACIIDLMTDMVHYAASEGTGPERLWRLASLNFEIER